MGLKQKLHHAGLSYKFDCITSAQKSQHSLSNGIKNKIPRWAFECCTVSSAFIYRHFQLNCPATFVLKCLSFSFLQILDYFPHFTSNAFPINSTDGKAVHFSRTISFSFIKAKGSFLFPLTVHTSTTSFIQDHVLPCATITWAYSSFLRPQKPPHPTDFFPTTTTKTSFISR